MPLAKEIEFPLFHRGTFTSANGTPVVFTDEKLKLLARNSNFVIQSGVLTPPIKYDHPAHATSKENHGRILPRFTVRDGTLYAVGSDWSDTLANDAKALRRVAYSGEMHESFEYPDPKTGKQVAIGPTVVGLAILGADRPAIKNLRPLESFDFGESVPMMDAWETREQLRGSGLVAQYCEGTKFFGEVENDARRFFEETKETPMTEAEKLEMQNAIAAGIKAAVQPLNDKIAAQDAQIKNFSEEQKTRQKVVAFCETIAAEKPLGKSAMTRLDELLTACDAATFEKVRSFVEALPAFVVKAGTETKKEKKAGDDDAADDDDEPKALAALRIKHFAAIDEPANQVKIDAGLVAFAEFKPEAFKGLEQNPGAQIMKLREYVETRDSN